MMESKVKNTIRKYHIIKPLFVWVLCLQSVIVFADVKPTYSAKPLYSTSHSSVWSKQHSSGGGISPIGATGISSYGGISGSSIGGTSFGTRSNVSLSFNYERNYSVSQQGTTLSPRRVGGDDHPLDPNFPPVGDIPFALMTVFLLCFLIRKKGLSDIINILRRE